MHCSWAHAQKFLHWCSQPISFPPLSDVPSLLLIPQHTWRKFPSFHRNSITIIKVVVLATLPEPYKLILCWSTSVCKSSIITMASTSSRSITLNCQHGAWEMKTILVPEPESVTEPRSKLIIRRETVYSSGYSSQICIESCSGGACALFLASKFMEAKLFQQSVEYQFDGSACPLGWW